MLRVFIPRFHQVCTPDSERYTSYSVEVAALGKFSILEKRYSQFLSLHSQLRKTHRTPEFPPKKLRNTSRKLIESRRLTLEAYLQHFVKLYPVPHLVLEFLEICPEDVKASSWDKKDLNSYRVLGYPKDAFLDDSSDAQTQTHQLPNIVIEATLGCFYGSDTDPS